MSQILFVRLEASVLVCSPVQVELGGLTVGAKKVNTRFYCIFFFFFFFSFCFDVSAPSRLHHGCGGGGLCEEDMESPEDRQTVTSGGVSDCNPPPLTLYPQRVLSEVADL